MPQDRITQISNEVQMEIRQQANIVYAEVNKCADAAQIKVKQENEEMYIKAWAAMGLTR